jgi:adenylate cyclase
MTDEQPSARARMVALAASAGLVEGEDVALVVDLVERAATIQPDLDDHALVGLVQAYGRAIDRIAAAEADLAANHLVNLPPEAFDRELATWLRNILPLAVVAFGIIQAHGVEQLTRRRVDALELGGVDTGDVSEVSVAVIDLRQSTAFMLTHDPSEICALVDDLYFVTSEIAAEHEVLAGKFLGDGVMLFSRHGSRLLRATRVTLEALSAKIPLGAGAGCARGPVLRRAGDWFGTPVNLAARLSELAAADEILVDDQAIPKGFAVATFRTVALRGLPDPRRIAVL